MSVLLTSLMSTYAKEYEENEEREDEEGQDKAIEGETEQQGEGTVGEKEVENYNQKEEVDQSDEKVEEGGREEEDQGERVQAAVDPEFNEAEM